MSSREPRLSLQSLQVLSIFVELAPAELAGADIAKRARVGPGTLYPILMRLEEAEWLTSQWEDIDPKEAGRPRRRFYRITSLGLQRAQSALSSFVPIIPILSPSPSGMLAWAR